MYGTGAAREGGVGSIIGKIGGGLATGVLTSGAGGVNTATNIIKTVPKIIKPVAAVTKTVTNPIATGLSKLPGKSTVG